MDYFNKFSACFFICLFFSSFTHSKIFAQNPSYSIEAEMFRGAILPHSKQIEHLITEKPIGLLLSVNKTTDGSESWHNFYNYPEIGLSFHYQDNKNETLGNLMGLYAHSNFYFLNRKLQLRIAQGFAYATNPYSKENNFRNMAYGTHFMPSTYFKISYIERNLFKNLGLQAGILFIHHSNATIKSPNTSTNTLAFNLGLNYSFEEQHPTKTTRHESLDKRWQIVFNFRGGINESHILGMGQKPFYHLNFTTQRRLGYSGNIQFGTELFLSKTLKEMIPFLSHSFAENNINTNNDWKRIGISTGYELLFGQVAVEGQVGFYVYDKYKQNGSIYQRLGLKYYFNNHLSAIMSLKTHFAKAEAFEIGFGYKL